MPTVIHGLRGDLRLEILIVFNGQWMSRSEVVLLMNLEYALSGLSSWSTKSQFTRDNEFLKPLILLELNCLVSLVVGLLMLLKRGPFIETKLGKWSERSVTKLPDLIRLSASLVKMLSISDMLVVLPFGPGQTPVGRSIQGEK